MKPQTKIYVGLAFASILFIGILGGAAWSSHKISILENEVDSAKQHADEIIKTAAAKEREAAEYEAKIEYLENQLTDIQTIARQQDEELEKLNINTRNARDSVGRARRIRSVAATADELCQKLAELGHGCAGN